jgi:hypothetical protein
MAKVKIQGHASGTGILTVTAPNTSTDRTITLPDSTDTLAVNSDVTNKLPLAGGTMTGDLTLNGADIVKSGSDDLTIDSGGRIDLSADDNGEIRLWDGSSKYAAFSDDDDRLKIKSTIQDKDIIFVGNDGGVETTALKLDMSEGGLAVCYGGVAIGGTGASNTLEDYEEGTCTLQYSDGSTAVGSANTFKYTKVGRLVTVTGYLNGTNLSSLSGSVEMRITGFPFTSTMDTTFPYFTRYLDAPTNTINTVGYYANGRTYSVFYFMTDHGAYSSAAVNAFHNTSNDLYFGVTYHAT